MRTTKKMRTDLLSVVSVTGAMLGILEIAYPIVCRSFRALSSLRLHKLGNPEKAGIITEYWENNVGGIYYLVLLFGGYLLMNRLLKNYVLLKCTLLLGVVIFPVLAGYCVWQDFPRPSPRADFLSEAMMISLFCLYFPLLNQLLGEAIVKRAFDHRFWVAGGIYMGLYLFVCPALIGDAITIFSLAMK